MKGFLRSAD